MNEKRLQEIKDSINIQYEIIGDNEYYKEVKLLIDEEQELVEEIERLQKENNDLRKLYQRTYKHLFEIGNDELARYFQAQIDECKTFYVEPIIDYYEETKRLHSIIKEVRELLENDYFEDGSFENYYKVFALLGSDKE